ncbi:hypothetical protein SLS61_006095 [Didymella pomorum]
MNCARDLVVPGRAFHAVFERPKLKNEAGRRDALSRISGLAMLVFNLMVNYTQMPPSNIIRKMEAKRPAKDPNIRTPVRFQSVPKFAALKVMTAGYSAASVESTILDHISASGLEDFPDQHIIILLDSFQHEGLNGTHRCLVVEKMGASAASLVEEHSHTDPEPWDVPYRYPVNMAKKIIPILCEAWLSCVSTA